MKSPERTCMACRNKSEKGDLIRIVKEKKGQISIDNTYKINGRGMYICKNKECIQKAIKTRAVSRAFRQEVPNSIYEKLEEML